MQTFVIRLWVPAGRPGDAEDFDPGLRGRIEHVGSGWSATFRGSDQLLGMVQARLEHGRAGSEPAPARDAEAAARDVGSTITAAADRAAGDAERSGEEGKWAAAGGETT
jgi:hypothetical protein